MPATVAKPARRKQHERVAESSERLLAAAIELIAEQGFEKTTAAEIGTRAGYSRSMVRERYGSKEHLLETALRTEFEPLMLRPAPEGVSGMQALLKQVDVIRDAARESPSVLRAFFVLSFETVGPIGGLRSWMDDWLKRYEEQTAASLRAGQEDGSVDPAVVPEVEARQVVMTGLGLAFLWILRPDEFDVDGELAAWGERLRSLAA